ncbi:MAG: hypothetical protein SO355_02465, partial [Candidatus Faecousia sp.]|nr:hypothetical protein [Candidatus Faecousia sp.]
PNKPRGCLTLTPPPGGGTRPAAGSVSLFNTQPADGKVNWNFAGRFVGNAFMHSAWVMILRRCVEWKNVDSFRREQFIRSTPFIVSNRLDKW